MPIFVSAQNGQAFKSRAFARSPRIGWIHVKKAIPRSGRPSIFELLTGALFLDIQVSKPLGRFAALEAAAQAALF